MICSLLLQVTHATTITASDLTNVYIALGGTIFASLLAAFASLRSSSKATITAERVASLTTQTARDVAALSAQVTRESADLAARTAQELKQIDYKNDFYKRIIDKRLTAWSNAEKIMNDIGSAGIDKDSNEVPIYFASWDTFDKVIEKLSEYDMESIWISRQYSENITSYLNRLFAVRASFFKINNRLASDDNDDDVLFLLEKGKEYHGELHVIWKKSMSSLGREIVKLDNIDLLFKDLSELGDAGSTH